jgi:hypothetical protein
MLVCAGPASPPRGKRDSVPRYARGETPCPACPARPLGPFSPRARPTAPGRHRKRRMAAVSLPPPDRTARPVFREPRGSPLATGQPRASGRCSVASAAGSALAGCSDGGERPSEPSPWPSWQAARPPTRSGASMRGRGRERLPTLRAFFPAQQSLSANHHAVGTQALLDLLDRLLQESRP